jgi:UDP-N-acetylmuramoyl-L-alanyl-D-glutamate--2,6-diaminopimelate ligase
MKLKELIRELDVISIKGDLEREIIDIAYHHGRAGKGILFVAIRGNVVDGHEFIQDAITNGANAVVTEDPSCVDASATFIVVKDARAALARLSSRFFGEPSQNLRLLGVTGTNGKTTITYLLESMSRQAGLVPGVVGTVEHRFNEQRLESSNTTPESYDLQKLLRQMVDGGVNVCAMEVSSHALTLERVVGCHFDGAIFTNLSPEHLDFHGEMETYFESKVRLFREHLAYSTKHGVFAAINADDPYGQRLAADVNHYVLRYSLGGKAEVVAEDVVCTFDGIEMKVRTPAGQFDCSSKLLGRFNAQNILAAVAGGLGLGLPLKAIKEGIEKVIAVPGRLEKVENSRDILALVDYAHTPDALEKVLSHTRELSKASKGRLIVVFGCGGNRDRAKRPLMGKTAVRLADVVIVTSDNPRNEDPDAIIQEIFSGIDNRPCEVIPDRKTAIKRAVGIARAGDIVVVAGKGHENYQIVGGERRHFDDREVLREFFESPLLCKEGKGR